MGSSVSGKTQSSVLACLSGWEVQKSPRRELFSKTLISGNIFKLLGRVLVSSCLLLGDSCVSMEVWVMSLRNNTHSYPTEIWNCRCWKYRVLKSWSRGFCVFFFYNILKVFSLCQLHIIILKERSWYLENTMCLFPSARCTMNSLCFGVKWWGRKCPQIPRASRHTISMFIFSFSEAIIAHPCLQENE